MKNNKEDLLNKEEILSHINDFYYEIDIFDSISSTNDYVKEKAYQKKEGYVCISNSQTKGKGRNGKEYFSPKDKGIYMSILLKPTSSIHDFLKITACASVAVFDAINKNYGINSSIKWINDLYINDKKIGGILCESVLNSNNTNIDYMILGIGLNVHKTKFKNNLSKTVSCIENFTDNFVSRNSLIIDILMFLNKYYNELESLTFLKKYKEHSNILHTYITVNENNTSYTAYVEDIDNNACLIIRKEDNTQVILNCGEVTIRKNK
ncbi:MAG: biotin--[acetyl-CoA-carboxylase] ligase [Tenericutes bacterium]|nr:biotin--[acetyl-CoA-carboxylase] ligase [Mycoplasmatota bacterium]